jgi:hypothetical protein
VGSKDRHHCAEHEPDQECEPDDRGAFETDQCPLRDLISSADQVGRKPGQYADAGADQSGTMSFGLQY